MVLLSQVDRYLSKQMMKFLKPIWLILINYSLSVYIVLVDVFVMFKRIWHIQVTVETLILSYKFNLVIEITYKFYVER